MALFTKPQFNSVWGATGVKLTPDPAKISQGWVVEIPPYEYENWSANRQDALLAHLNQLGVPQWDGTVEYQGGKSYVQGTTTGVVYRAITTNTNINPELDVSNNWQVAFEGSGVALLKSQNLADVPNKAAARTNLGIATTEFYDGRYLVKSENLADVPNKATARNNLGLGNSATTNVGTTAGTVAAGNDGRIVNAVPNTRTVHTGNGLLGGGDLASNRVISLGTPSHVTAYTGNTVSGTSHTHALDISGAFQFNGSYNGSARMPNGMLMIWGETDVISEGTHTRNFHMAFPNYCLNVQLTPRATSWNATNEFIVALLGSPSRSGFSFGAGYTSGYNSASICYFAVGF